MAEVCWKMVSDDDSSAKCREARRRRVEMRKFTSIASTTPSLPEKPKRKVKRPEISDRPGKRKRNRTAEMVESPPPSSSSSEEAASSSDQIHVSDMVPVFGSISVSGRSREMEDAISSRPDFCRPEITGRRPVHFFAVYDGHGGSHVAKLCKERMHEFLEEELMRVSNSSSSSSVQQEQHGADVSGDRWRSAIGRCFERMDEVALSACACGIVGAECGCERAGVTSEIVGSTAVVAALNPDSIIVANCGDSRAVLSRGGRAIPLSFDHKPDRPDELERIEAAGGRVIYLNGARVLGILAMSRALGDKYLKPIVISEPEVTVTERTQEDECLILASDGLWDVLSNEMACEVARKCLHEGNPSTSAGVLNTSPPGEDNEAGGMYQTRCTLAAALLTRLALGRKSADNISVIVIDLRS
ncbi:hypothetical protein HHK36_000311 [Tetracentron sinense]|uniref:protein-serine/threonine phosphatase n=1 Tax=Tetracentron sinense TaxID=13715 RepID=A0A834ZQV6_TETSI|nr:hypothetical protein HHK36_000311 [Tetracentron sinense]